MMIAVLALADFADASAQLYRRENRRAGRAFAEGDYEKALQHYEKALQSKGTDSLALMYNRAYVLHSDRRDSTQNMRLDSLALEALDAIAGSVAGTGYEYDYHYTRGVIDIDMENWEGAVDEFRKCILLDPEDMTARENYVFAKEHLKRQQDQQQQDQQQQQNNQDQDQNQDGQQDQQQNQDQNGQQDQNGDQQDEDQNKDDQQDQDQNGDRNKDQQDRNGQGQPQESKISQQAAQQILQAMQAKERETQDKVEKKKAAAMKSKQKEKNW